MKAHRINLEKFDAERYPEGFVEVKAFRSLADVKALEVAGITIAMSGGVTGSKPEITAFDAVTNETAPLIRALVGWSLVDSDGEPLPATEEGVLSDELPADLGEWLLEQVAAYYESTERSKSVPAEPQPEA